MKKLYIITLLLAMMTTVMAQTPNIRYVKKTGAYANDGRSWDNAKNNIQDAINDLVDNGLTGEVWVAAGTYTPTESTEQSGGSTLYMAFKIPAGITVRGGFAGTETKASERDKTTHNLMGEVYTNKTVLSGKLAATATKFDWNETKQKFDTKFYGNTYHVVWFAMNGFDASGRANPLNHAAELEGCVIEDGHANNSNLAGHPHNAYGGGIYMVANAQVRNCEVRHCDASRDGGGIYMDGGGHIEHTFVHDCQTLGTGVENGFGGGVCIDGGSTPDLGVISRSAVCNNVGRIGGGLCIKVSTPAYKYNMAASTTLVSNNTSTAAGGGVFLYKGGAIADLSILANRCNGSGIIANDIQTGRSGGLFVFDHAKVANTVMWGNRCDANRNVQYASSRQSNSVEKVDMKFCALSNADYCDWNNTKKHRVLSLNNDNTGTASHNQEMGFPIFTTLPVATAGDKTPLNGHIDAAMLASVNWQVSSESALHHAGIQTIDLDEQGKTDSPELTVDVKGENFNPRVTLGAYVSAAANIQPQIDGSNVNFYVDPNYVFGEHSAEAKGNSWTLPTRFLANVLELVKSDAAPEGAKQWKNKTINIYVKEGTINNTDSYRTGRVREMAIEVPSNVNIYGGYAASLTGTDLSKRNPRLYQTVITGEIMGNFDTNVAHLVKLTNVSNVTIDGVQIRDANAWSTAISTVNQNGAAVTIKNSTDIQFKNVLIANNLAAQGTAIYADGSSVVSFENCIFHNNTSQTKQGIIFADDDAKLTFDHCDVLRNVGHASWLDRQATNRWTNSIFFANLSEAVENTNISEPGAHPKALHSFAGSNTNEAKGARCMFDAASEDVQGRFGGNDTGNQWQYNLQYKIGDTEAAGYPRFINPTRNAGHTIGGDVTFYGRAASYEPHNLNPIVNAASHEVAHTSGVSSDCWGTDMSTVTNRDFGGLPDIGAIENHQDNNGTWENSYLDGQMPYGTVAYVRDYATENGTTGVDTYDYNEETGEYVKNAEGKGKYNVKHELLNGSSWEYALNGNAPYAVQTIQENTFVLSYMDGSTRRYLGYDTKTVKKTVQQEKLGADGLPERDAQGNVIMEEVEIDVEVPDMKTHPEHTGNTNWYRMSTTTTEANAVHFYVKNNKIYFDLDRKTYGIGYSTKGERRTIVFIENFNNSDNFVTADAGGDLTNCRVGGYWFYVKNNGGELYLEANNTGNAETKQAFALKHDETEVHGNGLMYAVIKARGNNIKRVHVAKGEYTNVASNKINGQKYAYIMEEGVDVLGGYPETGNPGEDERNPKLYETILQIQRDAPLWKGDDSEDTWEMLKPAKNFDVASVGRVLVQPNSFSEETKWDGFTIRHGFLHSWYRHNIRGNIASINTANIGHAGGAGVYLMGNGVLENCEIKDNAILVIADKTRTQAKGEQASNSPDASAGGFHQAGAGVYMTGTDAERGIIKNSVISGNQLLHKYWQTNTDNEESAWMYGAGLYQDNGIVFNTLIKDNEMRVIKGNRDNDAGNSELNEVLVGAGAFLVKGEFYNNTIVNNKTQTFAKERHNRHVRIPGVYVYNSMAMYNSIVAGNVSLKSVNNVENTGGSGTKVFDVPVCSFNGGNYTPYANNVAVHYSFIDVTSNDSKNICKLNDEGSDVTKRTNIYLDSKGDGNYNLSEIYDAGNNYRLIASSPCFNAGTESIKNTNAHPDGPDGSHPDYSPFITIPDEDADYTFRIKDCAIDIGVFEFNGAVGIEPELFVSDGVTTTDKAVATQAVYYVTPEGYGLRNASDPENAACAQKLQKVIDAAGRYKFENPTINVVVKVANSYALEHDSDPVSHFKYYATRTTDQGDENVRVWSIIIPRGVEVWGGYTDVARTNPTATWSNTDNGFKKDDGKDDRNIVANPTYFDSYYQNKLTHSEAFCYHVVTFTDRVFDFEGTPYLKADLTREGSAAALFATRSTYNPASNRNEGDLLHMSDVINTTTDGIANTNLHRAVLDGIFVTGGKADAKGESTSATKNINQYGGAAIVTDYAHVRNCILKGNKAINGGALALKNHAMVSGSLMLENSADNHGGALYVFENGTELSDGTTITAAMDESAQYPDHNLSHVFTTTVVKNTAQVGGGLWFSENNPNVRVNSSVFWGNTAPDQANVAGEVNPEKPVDNTLSAEAFYPFAYSAIQDVRASGTNNISLSETNVNGARFAGKLTDLKDSPLPAGDPSDTEFSPYYGIMHYSTLTHAGMPVQNYDLLMAQTAVSATDFTGRSRMATASKAGRKYVEIGARAFDKLLPDKQLMLRLYVARPEDTDINTVRELYKAGVGATAGTDAEYYGQEGSSFGYPFQTLYEALEYIKMWRTNPDLLTKAHANNLPFEIFISKGTYYPKMDLKGRTDHALAATFAIPEGVSLYGGFKANDFTGANAVPEKLYGKGYVPNTTGNTASGMADGASIDDNVSAVGASTANIAKVDAEGNATGENITIYQTPTLEILAARDHNDNNANSIIEPWEFKHQTILSGDATNDNNNGVYHVVTVVADQNVNGNLPKASRVLKADDVAEDADKYGMDVHFEGQRVRLNGLRIQDGYAYHYVPAAFSDDQTSDYNYYHGGGLLVDGNRFNDHANGRSGSPDEETVYKHKGRTNAVGYRDIPVSISGCQFIDNRGGFGGAISANTSLEIYESAFMKNQAVGMSESFNHPGHGDVTVEYPGNGGAIHSTYKLSAFNTLFANNEAVNNNYPIEPKYYHTLRNERGDHPTEGLAIPGGAGGAISVGKAGFFHIANCNFVRNQANMYPAVFTMNPNYEPGDAKDVKMTSDLTKYNQLLNSVFWGNEVNPKMAAKYDASTTYSKYKFASRLITNYGGKDRTAEYSASFKSEYTGTPANQAALDGSFAETVWFSAYEDGRGITTDNTADLRDMVITAAGTDAMHIIQNIKDENSDKYQNCNITIASENNVIEGPNFMNPSKTAGVFGYMDNADWSPARMNKFTDQGSGKLTQEVSIASDGKTYQATFDNVSAATGVYAVSRRYNTEHTNNVPIGNEEYMKQVIGTTTRSMLRISSDPAPNKKTAYIDMGVYEYVHNPLVLNEGDEVDVLWVSTEEKPANGVADGSSWEQPTSDLQRAIETLLASRNGHRKEIRLMDGTYTPLYTIENVSGFYIDTKRLNGSVVLPEGATDANQMTYNVRSFTIKGGYSRELEGECDATKYPAVIAPQQRMPGNSTRWDHLIYIADATQRYGLVNNSGGASGADAYEEGNNYGATPNGGSDIKTIPIEIDGVTVFNDQVNPLSGPVQGAAIYYAPQTGSTGTFTARVTTGITYYTNKERTIVSTDPTPYYRISSTDKTDPAKLIISKSKIINTGKPGGDKNVSAVYIGQGAGHALLYNNVFHSNNGDPLEAYDSKTINNTFAVNAGVVNLMNSSSEPEAFKSSILNTAMWHNNLVSTEYGVQFSLPGITAPNSDATIFRNNAYTGGEKATVDQLAGLNYNVGLISTNNDLSDGPNFTDPANHDYSIKASNRLLNKGNSDLYYNTVAAPAKGRAAGDPERETGDIIYDYAEFQSTHLDAAYQPRLIDNNIEVGAYEYQQILQRVFYVDPIKTTVDESGTSWEHAMGNGEIQSAIDMGALYHMSHSTDPGDNSAYVFVKGRKDFHSTETLTLRDGVKIFGSMPSGYTKEHSAEAKGSGTDHEKENNQLAAYLKRINNDRAGIAEPNASKTTISGVKVDDKAFTATTESLLDGFVVSAKSPENPEGKADAAVLQLTPTSAVGVTPKVAIRNVIVSDNDVSDHEGTNIAEIDNALIYEVLMRDNKVHATNGAVMKLGSNGWAVNVTVEGKSLGAGDSETQYNTGTHIYNSLVNYAGHAETENTLSGYNYELEDKNLNYQLTEKSMHIDACVKPAAPGVGQTLSPLNGVTDAVNLAGFIDYRYDRDLLGNPRMMKLGSEATNLIDRGAFETWKVDVEAVTTDKGIATDADTDHNGWSGTHYYPHHGSVVYVMDGKNLISNHELVPGFLLIQKGASLYGNGYDVNAAYVAVERNIKQEGSIVALPYAMKYNSDDAAAPTYGGDGVLTLTGATSKAWNYSGSERSAWDYVFARKDANAASNCWHEIADDASTDAYNGVLYEAKNAEGGRLVRFIAKGADMADYVYTESGVSKTVELRKYDDAESSNHDASFTNPLDMGWNCFGIPYLVSEYRPYEKVAVDAGENTVEKDAEHGTYSMSRSHTLWLYYDGVHTPDTKPEAEKKVDGDGGYYSVKSWLSSNDLSTDNPWHVTSLAGQAIWVGEGIFTQTATLDDTESLVFYRPIYTAPTPGGGSGAKGTRIYGDPTSVEETMEEDVKAEDVELVNTEYFTTDGVQINKPRRGAIVIIKRTYSNGAVKATKQFVK